MTAQFRPPLLYTLFFLYVEPLSTILGACYAQFRPVLYLSLTDSASAPPSDAALPLATRVSLSQLANLYFLFALNEGLVLRIARDIRVWRALLFGLLVADFGHLLTLQPLGHGIYWKFWNWNAIDWGNVAFVYLGALTRISFLCGLGLPRSQSGTKQKRTSPRGVPG